MKNYPKILTARVLEDYRVLLSFSNGENKIFDFTESLSHPYYKELKNIALFKNFKINDGEIEWASGQDFCPHTLYDKSVNCP